MDSETGHQRAFANKFKEFGKEKAKVFVDPNPRTHI